MPKDGTWAGWFASEEDPDVHEWTADFVTDGARFRAEGSDDLGSFTLEGEVDGDTVRFVKRYEGHENDAAATVQYEGRLEGDDHISGDWKLPDGSSGIFGAEWSDGASPERVAFDVESFRELIREIQPMVRQIEERYHARFPSGLPHWTELPDEVLAELPGGDDSMNDLWSFFMAIDEHALDGFV